MPTRHCESSTVRDPEAVLRTPPSDFLRFLDAIASGLMSPCGQNWLRGWQTLYVENARVAGVIKTPLLYREILRNVLAGAMVHRLISRTRRPKEQTERA
jgi:hypothetical protein